MSITTRNEGNMHELTIAHAQTPSWKCGGDGRGELRISHHAEAGWVSVVIEETAYPGEGGGRVISKYASITVEPAERPALIKAIAPGLAESHNALVTAAQLVDDAVDAGFVRIKDDAQGRQFLAGMKALSAALKSAKEVK